jgi:fumarate hydratase subunit alpha
MKTPDDTAILASLADATFQAYREAVICLPPDVKRVIERAAAAETNPVARGEFANILQNIKEAERLGVPPGHRCPGRVPNYSS